MGLLAGSPEWISGCGVGGTGHSGPMPHSAAELEDSDRSQAQHDDGTEHGGQENDESQREGTRRGEEADLDAVKVLEDEDQYDDQEDKGQNQSHPKPSGPTGWNTCRRTRRCWGGGGRLAGGGRVNVHTLTRGARTLELWL